MVEGKTSPFDGTWQKIRILLPIVFVLATDIVVANLYKQLVGFSWPDRQRNEAERVNRTYRIRSDIYHHDLAKNSYIESAVFGPKKYVMITDSLGFRSGTATKTPRKVNKPRILFLGDSFTEGVGVEYANTFVGLIASELSTVGIDVLNAAVASYSPIIYWRKVKHLIEDVHLKFDEVVLFLDISDIQDEAELYQLSSENTVESTNRNRTLKERAEQFLRRNTILIHLLWNLIHDFVFDQNRSREERKLNGIAPSDIERSKWTVDTRIFENYGRKGLKKAEYFMNLLHGLLREHNIKLTIAVYPWPLQIVYSDLASIQVQYWEAWAKKKQIPFLNYFPCFIKTGNDDQYQRRTLERFFFSGDVHWNENGHKLIAAGFLSYFKNRRTDISESGTLAEATPVCCIATDRIGCLDLNLMQAG